MEVHAHSHSHGKKNWRSYFWEFLMLFLAVFCGFLAENWREHLVEHQREKQYMQSMIQDLQADTATLNFITENFSRKIPSFDTVVSEFPKLSTGFSSPFVRNIFNLFGYEDLVPNDRTLQQLKNAGGMRLIRKKNVSDSIMEYDKKMKDLLIEQGGISDFYFRNRDLGELINIELLVDLLKPGMIEKYEKENKNLLVSQDKSLLSKYMGYEWEYQGVASSYISELKDVEAYASRLIDLIRQEYHLK
jgi:hypothetical protein